MALSSTVRHGISRSFCCMYATLPRRCGTGSPSNSTVPVVGWSKPAMMFRSVVLPQPLGPMIETNWRSATWKSTPSKTESLRWPDAKTLPMPLREIRGAMRRDGCISANRPNQKAVHYKSGGLYKCECPHGAFPSAGITQIRFIRVAPTLGASQPGSTELPYGPHHSI